MVRIRNSACLSGNSKSNRDGDWSGNGYLTREAREKLTKAERPSVVIPAPQGGVPRQKAEATLECGRAPLPTATAAGTNFKTPLLTYKEAAEFLTISVRELRRLVSAGLVRAVRLGYRTVRFRPVELEKSVQRRES